MNNMLKYRILVLSVSLLIVSNICAQNHSVQTHDEQVTIVSSFDPTINQAYKQNISPEDLIFSIENPEFEYKPFDIELPTTIKVPPISPITINIDKRIAVTKNSVKVGIGSLFTPLVDFFHSSGKKKDYRFDAHFYHLSSFKNIPNYANSPETNTKLNLDVRKFFGYHVLDAGFDAGYKTTRWYGFKPDDFTAFTYNDDDLKQSFTHVKANVSIASNYKNNNKLHHEIKANAYYYFDKHDTKETNANLKFDIHKNFDVSDLLDYQELGLSGQLTYYNTKDSLTTNNDLLIETTPYFTGNYGMFNFYVGLNFNFLNTNSTDFYFYPKIDVNINLIPEVFTVFAGVTGDVKKHSYYALSEENQWVNPIIPTTWGRSYTLFGGIRGNIAKKVNYSAKLYWQNFKNEYFFINSPFNPDISSAISQPYNKFSAVYDDGSIFGFTADLTYAATEKLSVDGGVSFMTYSLDSLSEAYQKPSLTGNIGFSYMVTKQLKATAAMYYYGERKAYNVLTPALGDIKMDPFVDLNIGLNYSLTNEFSIFLNVNNILNNDYQVFNGYPVHGIQIMGGLTYRF